jgi:GNAT superfamily N-acetyltransferase
VRSAGLEAGREERELSLRVLDTADEGMLYEYLASGGLEALFLLSAVEEGELRRPRGARTGEFTGCFSGGRLVGVHLSWADGYQGLYASDPGAARRFASEAGRRAAPRVVSGGPRSVDPYWEACEERGLRARLNWRLLGYRVDRATLSGLREPALRSGTPADLREIIDLERRSYMEEVGEDPVVAIGEPFVQRIERRIRLGRSCVLGDPDRIVFKADLGVYARTGAEVHNVYTVPERRGEGIAARATSEMARRALATVPVVSLAVRPENAPAIRAYERAGFRRGFDFRLIFLERSPARS